MENSNEVNLEEKQHNGNEERNTAEMGGFAGSTTSAVGRMVDSTQAEDRRLIRLVRERRLLYARNNMPVASYYAQCKALWLEIANNMGRSVPEIRRKWSHIRNSYSRHLRNEVMGARTGRGRTVSKWYLADELDFLRDHMATDTRGAQYIASMETGVHGEGHSFLGGSGGEEVSLGGQSPLWTGGAGEALLQPKVEAVYAASEDSTGSFGADEDTSVGSLASFFRPLQGEWAQLNPRRRRLYLRQSLALLHALLDEQDAESNSTTQYTQSILPNQ